MEKRFFIHDYHEQAILILLLPNLTDQIRSINKKKEGGKGDTAKGEEKRRRISINSKTRKERKREKERERKKKNLSTISINTHSYGENVASRDLRDRSRSTRRSIGKGKRARRVSIVNHAGPGGIAREDKRREKGSGIGDSLVDNERYSRPQKG